MGTRDRPIRTRRTQRVALLLSGAVLLTACGGDSGGGAADDLMNNVDGGETATTQPPPESSSAEIVPDDEITATIDPPLQLAGTSWVVTNYNYRPSDTGITNTLGEEVVFVLGEDGTLTGHNGCNEFAGTWETTGPYYVYDDGEKAFEDKLDGQPITVAAELTTTIECEGFLADQDADLMGALVAAEIWYIGNDLGDKETGITLHAENARIYADPA